MLKRLNIMVIMGIALFIAIPAWATLSAESAEQTETISWKDYETGMAMAKTQGKKVFLYFHADWCTYCKKMEGETFKEASVISYLNENFIAITVDSDKEKKIAGGFGVRGLPTSWFLKSDGDRLSSMPGYIDADRLLTILKFISTESYKAMSYQDFKRNL